MQDRSDKCYESSQKELEVPSGPGVKSHKRSFSNVTLVEMAAKTMDMRKHVSASGLNESPQHSDERRFGFVEALSTSHDIDVGVETGTDTSSPARSVDVPLTDSDVEDMEYLFSN